MCCCSVEFVVDFCLQELVYGFLIMCDGLFKMMLKCSAHLSRICNSSMKRVFPSALMSHDVLDG